MHMYQPDIGFVGSSPILSSALPISLGVALSQREDKGDAITVSFIGDGATEEGNFYECLNLASLWGLPIVIVVEDNKYAVNSPKAARRPEGFDFEHLSESMGLQFARIRSREPIEAMRIAHDSVSKARNREPVLVHLEATRFMTHSAPLYDDSAAYRQEIMEMERKQFDPVGIVKSLVEQRLEKALIASLHSEIEANIQAALEQAVGDPEPEPDAIYEGLYAKIH